MKGALKIARLSAPDRRCSECWQPVPTQAKICPACKAYQDWRRYLTVGQTSLALIVALISVLTAFVPVLSDALTPKNSNLYFDYQGSALFNIAVLASNSGTRPGTVLGGTLTMSTGPAIQLGVLNPSTAAAIIEAGKTVLVSFRTQPDQGYPTYEPEKVLNGTCEMKIAHRSFSKQSFFTPLSVPCKDMLIFLRGAAYLPEPKGNP